MTPSNEISWSAFVFVGVCVCIYIPDKSTWFITTETSNVVIRAGRLRGGALSHFSSHHRISRVKKSLVSFLFRFPNFTPSFFVIAELMDFVSVEFKSWRETQRRVCVDGERSKKKSAKAFGGISFEDKVWFLLPCNLVFKVFYPNCESDSFFFLILVVWCVLWSSILYRVCSFFNIKR